MKDWANDINFRRRIAEEKLAPWFWAVCVLAVFVILYSPHSEAADAKLLVDMIECESSGRYNVAGDDGISVDILQFRKETFEEMKVLAKMPKLRWKNPIHQMRLAVWMIDHGHGDRWTCYRKLKKGKTK